MSVNYPAIQKNNDNQNAIDVPVDTTAFNGILSAGDIDVQSALETIDDHTHTSTNISVDTTTFNGILSAGDTDVQSALETIDDHGHVQISRQEISTSQTFDVTDLTIHHVLVLTTIGITLTLNYTTGSHVTVLNRSGGICYINNIILGNTAPNIIYDLESFELIGNAIDLDLI